MQDRLLRQRIAASTRHVLLLGPRQVGKSTLCRSLDPIWTVNLADEGQFIQYSKDPDRFRREVKALKRSGLIVVDEAQRVPALLNTAQALIDAPENRHRFVFTGSSARKL